MPFLEPVGDLLAVYVLFHDFLDSIDPISNDEDDYLLTMLSPMFLRMGSCQRSEPSLVSLISTEKNSWAPVELFN